MSLSIALHTLKFIANHPLNREHKLASILRFAKWQVGSRLVPGAVIYEWINGAKFIVKAGESGLTGNLYTGLYEFVDMAFFLHFLRPEDIFIDIGANAGSYTILGGAVIGATGYSFEPAPAIYKRLVENIQINRIAEKVESINKAVGDHEGEITFTSGLATTNHVALENDNVKNTTKVQMTTLDHEMEDISPTLLKIDVEGYETPVLEGAQETLKKESLQAIIVEINGNDDRYGFDEKKTMQLMLDNGFKSYSYDPFERKLIDLNGRNLTSGNTLFLRDKTSALARLKNAPRISVMGKTL